MNNPSENSSKFEYGDSTEITRTVDELVVIHELLDLCGKDILDLGCGRGERTRAIAAAGSGCKIFALEVDEVQHAINLEVKDLDNVRFGLGGAEAIPADDCSFDIVFMFKSLHHVPLELMPRAFAEIARVLRPGGCAYISEPLFRGSFNEVLRIFHDESHVRQKAFEAILEVHKAGDLELASQTFFDVPVHFDSFDDFDRLVIRVTHSNHRLTDKMLEQVRSAFTRLGEDQGPRFEQPIRVDLLRKPLAE